MLRRQWWTSTERQARWGCLRAAGDAVVWLNRQVSSWNLFVHLESSYLLYSSSFCWLLRTNIHGYLLQLLAKLCVVFGMNTQTCWLVFFCFCFSKRKVNYSSGTYLMFIPSFYWTLVLNFNYLLKIHGSFLDPKPQLPSWQQCSWHHSSMLWIYFTPTANTKFRQQSEERNRWYLVIDIAVVLLQPSPLHLVYSGRVGVDGQRLFWFLNCVLLLNRPSKDSNGQLLKM